MREVIHVKGNKLAGVGVAGELQADFFFRRDGQMIGRVSQEDAGAVRVEVRLAQNRAEALGLDGIAVVHADELETVHDDLFIIEHANAGIAHCVEIFRAVAKLFMISGDEVGSQGRRKFFRAARRGGERRRRCRRTYHRRSE